jgi:hypothetical protein
MKNNRTLIQLVLVVLTFLIMALLIWGVWTGRLLDHKETQEQMMDGMINKMK